MVKGIGSPSFVEIKMYIFHCTGGMLGEVVRVFFTEKYSPDADLEVSDAREHPTCVSVLSEQTVVHRRV